MKLFGSLTSLLNLAFSKNSNTVTLQPSQSTTYTSSRTIDLPPEDANSVIVSQSATQTLTNKTLTSPVINTPTGIVKGDVGLGNVDNTSDATKNAASVTLTNKTIDGGSNTLTNVPLSAATGTLAAAKGGTGVSSTATFPTSGVVALVPGTSGPVKSNGSTALTQSAVNLTSEVTGALPIGNGGTGQTTASAAFGALSPLTTKGDLAGFSTVNARLPVGTNGQIIVADSAQALGVKWAANAAGSQATATTLGVVQGGTVPGSGNGAAIAAGYIGELVTVAGGTTTSSSSTAVQLQSLGTLQPGWYLITMNAALSVAAGSVLANIGIRETSGGAILKKNLASLTTGFTPFCLTAVVQVTAAKALESFWNTSSGAQTMQVYADSTSISGTVYGAHSYDIVRIA